MSVLCGQNPRLEPGPGPGGAQHPVEGGAGERLLVVADGSHPAAESRDRLVVVASAFSLQRQQPPQEPQAHVATITHLRHPSPDLPKTHLNGPLCQVAMAPVGRAPLASKPPVSAYTALVPDLRNLSFRGVFPSPISSCERTVSADSDLMYPPLLTLFFPVISRQNNLPPLHRPYAGNHDNPLFPDTEHQQ